jgi:hypothetical protein
MANSKSMLPSSKRKGQTPAPLTPDALPPRAVLAATGSALGQASANAEGGELRAGDALRLEQERRRVFDEVLALAMTMGDRQRNPTPPPKQRSRARLMADTWEALAGDQAFTRRSRLDQHQLVLDKLGVPAAQRKETGWSKKGLFNELSRRRPKQ